MFLWLLTERRVKMCKKASRYQKHKVKFSDGREGIKVVRVPKISQDWSKAKHFGPHPRNVSPYAVAVDA